MSMPDRVCNGPPWGGAGGRFGEAATISVLPFDAKSIYGNDSVDFGNFIPLKAHIKKELPISDKFDKQTEV